MNPLSGPAGARLPAYDVFDRAALEGEPHHQGHPDLPLALGVERLQLGRVDDGIARGERTTQEHSAARSVPSGGPGQLGAGGARRRRWP